MVIDILKYCTRLPRFINVTLSEAAGQRRSARVLVNLANRNSIGGIEIKNKMTSSLYCNRDLPI